jgi:hypothetical protein
MRRPSVAEKDIYKDLYLRMESTFGRERLLPESDEHNLIFSMVEKLADQIGPENVTELQLEGIREILDGEHDPTIHVSSL